MNRAPGPKAASLLATAFALLAGCGAAPEAPAPPQALARIADAPHETAVLSLRDLGEIEIELLPELAPATVAHWKALAAQGFYERTSFHRVIPGFMIQGGDPNTRNLDPRDDGMGGSEIAPPDEFSDYPQQRGTVAMAHKGRPHTAGSQFFILHGDARHLDGHYTVFGRVSSGMDVVDAIAKLEIDKYGRYGPRDRPYPVEAVVERVTLRPASRASEAVASVATTGSAGGAGANDAMRAQGAPAATTAAAPLASALRTGYPASPVAR